MLVTRIPHFLVMAQFPQCRPSAFERKTAICRLVIVASGQKTPAPHPDVIQEAASASTYGNPSSLAGTSPKLGVAGGGLTSRCQVMSTDAKASETSVPGSAMYTPTR